MKRPHSAGTMRARLTESFDLVLEWEDFGPTNVVFSLRSDSEFDIRLTAAFGSWSTSLTSLCYAYDVECFLKDLRKLRDRSSDTARFLNALEDVEIIAEKGLLTLRFQRGIDAVGVEGELKIPLGYYEDLTAAILAIHEMLTHLKPDCRHFFEINADKRGQAGTPGAWKTLTPVRHSRKEANSSRCAFPAKGRFRHSLGRKAQEPGSQTTTECHRRGSITVRTG